MAIDQLVNIFHCSIEIAQGHNDEQKHDRHYELHDFMEQDQVDLNPLIVDGNKLGFDPSILCYDHRHGQ